MQACPNGAITITVVDTVGARSTAAPLVPTAPPSQITRPTTSYHSDWGLPEGLRAAGATLGGGGRSHGPLVAMLVLTQVAAGALAVDLATGHRLATSARHWCWPSLGLAISVLHLGRPERAWRAARRLAPLLAQPGDRSPSGLRRPGRACAVADRLAARSRRVAAAAGLAGVACSGHALRA